MGCVGITMIDYEKLWQERNSLTPYDGLPFELFEWISSVVPIPNVDLLITNDKGEILLSWRDDEYYGQGWHLPGGCIRFKETIEERIQKTALNEIGTEVITDSIPIAVKNMIMGDREGQPIKRAHHVAMLIKCALPEGFVVDNKEKKEKDAGYLKWFDRIPEDILKVHDIYFDVFKKMDFNSLVSSSGCLRYYEKKV